MQQHALAAFFTVGLAIAPAQSVWGQDGEMQPLNPELIPAEPFDGCIDTLGEMIDYHAFRQNIPPLLLRNLYRDILDEAAANMDPNTPKHKIIDVPSFNQKLDQLDPKLRELLVILFREPTAGDSFGMGCDVQI